MKTKRILLFLLLFFGLAVSLKAEGEGNDGSNSSGQQIKKKKTPEIPGKAKAPSHVMILFSYNNTAQTAYFDLPVDVEYIDILLQNCETCFTFAGSVTAFDPEWYQPLSAGEYYIECTADNGDVYAGYVYI